MVTRSRVFRQLTLAAVFIFAGFSGVAHAQMPPPKKPSPEWLAEKAKLQALTKTYPTAAALYQHFKDEAGGGKTNPAVTSLPDWSGLWEREAAPFFFDPDQTSFTDPPPVKLTPAYQQELDKRLKEYFAGNDYDPISVCGVPSQFPRWLVEPFMREFVPTPGQTWMINEAGNEIRRIYTDGRGHVPAEAAYPLYEGDSIGFWDGQKLVIHTSQLKGGMLQRIQPRYSDKMETVEIWQKVGGKLQADVWMYDPDAFQEPWFNRQTYHQVSNEDGLIRIRFWACAENPNNEISVTKEGGSNFKDLTFTNEDDKTKKDQK